MRERVARARDNEPGKSNWARDSYVRRQTSKDRLQNTRCTQALWQALRRKS